MPQIEAEAAQLLGLTRPRLSALLNARAELFSLDALVEIAARAKLKVRINITRPYRHG